MSSPSNTNPSRSNEYAELGDPTILGLEKWGIANAKLEFISDTANIIFRAETPDQAYCIRINPDQSRTQPEIYGELYWLKSISEQTNLAVPRPMPTRSGSLIESMHIGQLDASFDIVVFDWLPGEIVGTNLNTEKAKKIGRAMAALHTHAESFVLPAETFRDQTDWQGMGRFLVDLSPAQISRIQSFLTTDQIDLCERVAQQAAKGINRIDTSRDFGLIHSDLHSKNCLIHNGKIGLIDFDDCQFSPFTGDMAITLSSFTEFANHHQLQAAFLQGYAEHRALPQNHEEEIEAFSAERQLRLLRWVSTWPSVDHFSFGRRMVENALKFLSSGINNLSP